MSAPVIVSADDPSAAHIWIVPGKDGTGIQLYGTGSVPAYGDLPALTASEAGAAMLVESTGLLYIWNGASWTDEADGVPFRGPEGDPGRGVSSIEVSGNNLLFTMSQAPTTETVAVPALSAAAANAAAASGSATAAGNARAGAEAARDAAAVASGNAAASSGSANAAADDAVAARDIAVTKAGEASASATAADASKIAAAGSATAASNSATSAGNDAATATSAAGTAVAARDDAVTARDEAQDSATSAGTSATNAANDAAAADADAATADTAATTATSAAGTATGAATTATSARDTAQAAAAAADASADAAAISETNAGASESNAGTSETNAAGSAAAASTSQTNAATSAGSAAASADEAEYWAGEAASAVSSGIPSATTSVKGGVQLSAAAGEVGGTFDHLIVNGWADKADLVGGKIPVSQLPQVAIVDVRPVADTAARLALTDVQTGDIAIQTGNPGRGTYILSGTDPSNAAHWSLMVVDVAVSSVNGFTGIVILGKGDVGLGSVDNTSDASKPVSTAQQAALDGKVPVGRTLTAGTGLTGGGDLTANRTLGLSVAAQTSLSLADSSVQPARAVAAGTGLTGGGDLSANRTIALSAGAQASLALADSAVQPAALAAAQQVAINSQTGTTYTLVAGDASKAVECSNASAIALTVPTNTSVAFAVGTVIEVTQVGAGQITVSGAGVTFNQAGGLKTRAQWSSIILRKRATDTWLVTGDTAT